MKEFIVIAGAVILGIALYALLVGIGGSNANSLAGSAQTLVNDAISGVGGLAP